MPKKITQLTEITELSGDEVIMLADEIATTPVPRKMTIANLLAGVGSTGGAPATYLDVPPETPHASDDEFDGATLDGKWSAITTAVGNTVFVANSWLIMEPADSGSGDMGRHLGCGIRQNSPSGSFSISAKVAHNRAPDEGRAGIFVAATYWNTVHIMGSLYGYNLLVQALDCNYAEDSDWSGYQGYNNYINGEYLGVLWQKIEWNAETSTFIFYISVDGVCWKPVGDPLTSQHQPTRMGIAIWGNSANIRANHQIAVDWFRVTEPEVQ